MKKNDDTYKPSEDFALMDMLFMAGWELGKANLTKSPDAALTLFKAASNREWTAMASRRLMRWSRMA